MSSKKRQAQHHQTSQFTQRRAMSQRTLHSGRIQGVVDTTNCVCATSPKTCQVRCALPAKGCKACKDKKYKHGHHYACPKFHRGTVKFEGAPHCEYNQWLGNQKEEARIKKQYAPLKKSERKEKANEQAAMKKLITSLRYDNFLCLCHFCCGHGFHICERLAHELAGIVVSSQYP